ncbi:MAG: glycosyltransferase 87 family protein [Anaerolineae bacterium]
MIATRQTTVPERPASRALPVAYRLLLAVAVLFHLSLLVSWRAGYWNSYTFDSTVTAGRRGWDFYALYQAGHNVLTGVSAYESDNDKIDVVVPLYTPFRYLPISAYTVGVALNLVSPLWAFRLWVAFVELVLLGCAAFCWRLARDPRRGAVAAVLWLLFTPFYLEIYLGQFSMIQSALILLMLAAVAGPELAAPRALARRFGLFWTLSLLWKQNTGLFVPVLLRLRRWRTLLWAGAAVALTSAPYFLLYPSALGAFLGNFQSSTPAPQLGNLGVRQFLYSLSLLGMPTATAETQELVQTVWVALVVAVTLWMTYSARRMDVALLLCLWTTTYFLVYHHVWEHHYVLLLPVFALLYLRTGSWKVLLLYALVAVWTPYRLLDPTGRAALDAAVRWTIPEARGLFLAYHGAKALPTLLLWGYVVYLIRRPVPHAESQPT